MENALDKLPVETACEIHSLFFHQVKTRKDVLDFERLIKALPDAFDECPYPLFHSFADGMYTREIHFNAGDLIVGAIHKNDYFVNVPKGRIWVVSEFGAKEIKAPAQFTAKAGVKHIGFTLEDTVWIDTHRTDKTNVEDAEKEIFVDSYETLDRENGILEYSYMCKEIDMTEDEAHKVSRIEDDLIDQIDDAPIEIKESKIQGLGVFATQDIDKNARIAIARVNNNRTPVGRYTNHSDRPNAEAVIEDNKGFFFALTKIEKDSEITVDYRDVRDKAILLDRCISCQDG